VTNGQLRRRSDAPLVPQGLGSSSA
jgi:hypothetical protein